MAAAGMTISGMGLILFPILPEALYPVCFGLLGFGLSMLRGPLVKIFSENAKPRYAQIFCVILSMIGFIGPLAAGLLVAAFAWNIAFIIAGIVSLICAVCSFAFFGLFEKKGMIKPLASTGDKKKIDLLGVFKLENFTIYLFLAMVIEALLSSIGFWIPTYLTEQLSYSVEAASGMYSFMSLLKSACPVLCIAVMALFKDDYMKMMGYMFAGAAASYFAMSFVESALPNLILFIVAREFSGFASAAMWTVYIPSLSKSGRVSGANGVLDCSGYIGASVSNIALAFCIDNIGWQKMPLAFGVIPFIGVVLCIVGKINRNKSKV